MRIQHGNIWDYYGEEFCVIGIPTNGTINKSGALAMGKGVAAEARRRIAGIDRELGEKVGKHGNNLYRVDGNRVFSFPTKNNWFDAIASTHLIERSACALAQLAAPLRWMTFYLPRPGCGEGRLDWEMVRPILRRLPGNVTILIYEERYSENGNDYNRTRAHDPSYRGC